MSWENTSEVTAADLRGPSFNESTGLSFNPDTTYVLLERDIYPKTLKIKLSELKKWMLAEIDTELKSVARRANVGYNHCQKIGPVSMRKGIC